MTSFDAIEWTPDGLRIDGWQYRYQHGRADSTGSGQEFTFYKLRPMIDEYQHFFGGHSMKVRSMLEIGMWDGGSLAFWVQLLNPERAVGVDIAERANSPYFDRWLRDMSLEERVATHWRVDQADADRLRSVLVDHDGMLDLVIDDASHLYGLTRSSFETVFPLVQPGGLYVIEDWAWEHWPEFDGPSAQWADERPMADFVHELIRFAACSDAVRAVSVYKNFVVVERGAGELISGFDITSKIRVRRGNTATRSLLRRRRRVGAALGVASRAVRSRSGR